MSTVLNGTLGLILFGTALLAIAVTLYTAYRLHREMRRKILQVLADDGGTLLITELYVRVYGMKLPARNLTNVTQGFCSIVDGMERDGLIESCRCTVREYGGIDGGDGYRLRGSVC